MHGILETVFLSKEFHQSVLLPVCEKYNMTYAEMVTLLFLAGNPELDTATDIVKNRRMAKSAVSLAVHSLEEKGMITGSFEQGNHRTIHLKILDKAAQAVEEGFNAQRAFISVMIEGFTDEEKKFLVSSFERVSQNIRNFYGEKPDYSRRGSNEQ